MRRRRRNGDDHLHRVFHVTQFDDGRYHVAGTQTGTFSFDPTDPGDAQLDRHLRTDDGEHARLNITTHITVVDPDVIVELESSVVGSER